MKSSRASEWLNLIASIGVLAGLILVAYELRQNNEIAEAETFRTMWEMVGELNKLGIQTDIQTLYRTSVDDPSSLSEDEVDRLSAFLTLALEIQVVKAVMRDSYGLYPITIEEQATDITEAYLTGRFARAWFEENEVWIDVYSPTLAKAIRAQIARTPIQMKYSYADELRSRATRIDNNE